MSNRGLAELAGHEGIVTSRYKDSVGVWTVGVGHTKPAGPPDPAKDTRTYEVQELIELFRKDVAKYESDVLRAVKVHLTQTQFDALVSFHYNTGGIANAQLTKSLNAKNFKLAGEQFMGWSKPAEIIPRRQKEQKLFQSGVYSNNGMANVYPASSSGAVQWGKGTRIDVLKMLETNASTSPPSNPDNSGVSGPNDGVSSPPRTPSIILAEIRALHEELEEAIR
ncbi:lysozyme [Aureimonas fodinaquatilis]|nr:lysozyme [Aureimonas fodinaquatilis]